ncbi:hypothetical protein XELAEV_18020067mg [Xenopus laevis]|uniref:Uncharacterized protein n=1 Tax=Xenopus laevis TaxID=8355 RepID=A0A974D915_XENLA|nr:hypothetical protein XELAEV_18020067mg [Xenopus laevis]
MTPWEQMVISPIKVIRPLSKIYKLLIDQLSKIEKPFCSKWAAELKVKITTSILNTIFPTMSKMCRRCNDKEGTHSQTQILLNYSTVNDKFISNPLSSRLLQAAKSLIPKKWKSPEAPMLAHWFSAVEYIKQRNYLYYFLSL